MRFRWILPLLILPVLAGCQSLPFGSRGAEQNAEQVMAAQNPITGGEISTGSLDAPSGTATSALPQVAAAAVPVAGAGPAVDAAAAPAARPAAGQAGAVQDGGAREGGTQDGAAQDGVAEPAPPTPVKSAAQIACERRGGIWSAAGGGAAAFCQSQTRDGGKSCRASSDCSGYCLAKSRTCAPVTPMLGCHDILNENGRMLTQCIN